VGWVVIMGKKKTRKMKICLKATRSASSDDGYKQGDDEMSSDSETVFPSSSTSVPPSTALARSNFSQNRLRIDSSSSCEGQVDDSPIGDGINNSGTLEIGTYCFVRRADKKWCK
jgi:hypothetical protein